MTIEIIPPLNDNEKSASAIKKLKTLLDSYNINYFLYCESVDKFADIIAVFGGDGTILSAARYATDKNAAILAINTGTVGFLSSVEIDEIENAVIALKNGDYTISSRTTLRINSAGDEYTALNDAVLERDKQSNGVSVISKLKLSIDNADVYSLRADGIILATPTGSTAYSLSAGGVVLTPDINAFIATPICSHSLTVRPIVYPDDKIATVEVLGSSSPCILCIDGKGVKTLYCGDKISISKNVKHFKIIDIKRDFFGKIKNKLGE